MIHKRKYNATLHSEQAIAMHKPKPQQPDIFGGDPMSSLAAVVIIAGAARPFKSAKFFERSL
jgi:hypothetical protein